jgi:hypothetical protein
MNRLIIAAIAAAFASVTFSAIAADEKPYTAQPSIEKPGRAADDTQGAVKSGGSADKPGRAADEATATTTAKPKHKTKKKSTTEEPAAPAK